MSEAGQALPARSSPTARNVHAASLLLGFLVLLWMDHRLWFGGDEWAMVARAESPLTGHNVFDPHNEHWSTIPIVEYRILLAWFGLRSYIPYLVVLIVVQILLAHLLWRLMRRIGVDDWIATILAAVFIVLGSGAQALQNAFNVSFVAAVCTGIGALLLVEGHGPRRHLRDAAISILLLLGLMCGPPAIPMVFAVGLLALLRRGWRAAAGMLALPVVAYAVWFAAIGHTGTSKDTVRIHGVPGYVLRGLASVFSLNSGWSQVAAHTSVGGTSVVGGLLGLLLLAWLVRHWREANGRISVAFVGATATVFFYVVVAFGRTRFGSAQSSQTRYVFVAVALLLPLFGIVLTRFLDGVRSNPLGPLVPVGCIALFTLTNVVQLSSSAGNLTNDSRVNKDKVFGSAYLIRSGGPIVVGTLIIPTSYYLTTDTIRGAIPRGWFGPLRSVTPIGRLDAESVLQVSATTRPRFDRAPALFAEPGVTSVEGGSSPSADACTTLLWPSGSTHGVTWRVDSPSSAGLVLRAPTTMHLILESDADPRTRSAARAIAVPARRIEYLNFLAGGFTAKVSLSAHRVEVCPPPGPGANPA